MPDAVKQFQAKIDAGNGQPPSAEERDRLLVEDCKDKVNKAKKITQAWAKLWSDGLNYIFNNQLADKRRGNYWPRVQMNTIFPAVHQELALLASRRPRIVAEGSGSEQTAKGAFWNGALQYRYDKTLKMGLKTILATMDGAWAGMFIAYVYPEERAWWNDRKQKWVYEPRVELVHPLYFGVDPDAETIEDASYVYCQKDMLVEEAIRTWPDKKDEIEEAARTYTAEGDQSMGFGMRAPDAQKKASTEKGTAPSATVEGELVGLINQARGGAPIERGGGAKAGSKVVTVTIVHFRDYAEEDAKETEPHVADELMAGGAVTLGADGAYRVADPEDPASDPENPPLGPDHPAFGAAKGRLEPGQVLSVADWPQRTIREYKRPKFPFGRVVYILGDKLLNPAEKDQRWDRRKWPYVVGTRLPLPHVVQGLNAVEMPRSSQDWINVTASHLLNYVKNFSDPARQFDEGSLLGKFAEKLKLMAGQVFKKKKGTEGISFVNPPPLSQGLIEVFQVMVRQAQDSMKMHDNALGGAARADQTATESSILQASTQTAVGLSIVFLDAWVLAVMEQVAELDMLYLEAGDAVRMAGTTDTPEMVVEYRDEYEDLDMDIKLDVGVALPHDQERRKVDVERLYKMFGPQNPYLWELAAEAFNVPDKKKFVQAMAEYQQFMQWREQQALMAQELAKQQEAAKAGAVPGAAGQPAMPGQGVPPAIAMGG